MTSNKWLLLFAVRIRHAAASCSGAIVATAGTAAALKLIVYLERAIQLPSLLFGEPC